MPTLYGMRSRKPFCSFYDICKVADSKLDPAASTVCLELCQEQGSLSCRDSFPKLGKAQRIRQFILA
jgi:hypothetical protein